MNKMITKGLVSVAAASMLSTIAFAGSSITTSASTTYYDTYPGVNIGIKTIGVQEAGVNGFGTTGKITFKLSSNAHLKEINSSGTGSDVNSSLLAKSAAYLGTSTSPKNLVVDLNNSKQARDAGIYIFHSDGNRSRIATFWSDGNGSYMTRAYASTSASNAAEFVRYDTLFDLNTTSSGSIVADLGNDASATVGSDRNVTIGKIYLDATTDETVISLAVRTSSGTLEALNLSDLNISADTNETGNVTISVSDGDASGGTTLSSTAGSLQIATLVAQPLRLTYTGTVPSASAGSTTAQPMVDFNLTAVGGITSDASTLKLTLTGAPINLNETSGISKALTEGNVSVNTSASAAGNDVSGLYSAAAGSTLDNNTTEGNLSTASSNTILVLELNGTVTNGNQISFEGNPLLLNTTSVATGTAVTATITGTGELSYLSIPAFTIANVVTDGVVVQEKDNNTTRYTTRYVVPGRTEQILNDINISEQFASSFATTSGANQITLTLPTGYTFSSKPTADIYSSTDHVATTNTQNDENNLTAALGTSSMTLEFAATGGDISLSTSTTVKEMVIISGLRVTVPSTAAADDVVAMTIAGNMISSTKTLSASTINVGTVTTSTASMTELNTTALVQAISTSTVDGQVAFDVNETFTGQLPAGNTIKVTLGSGTFSGLGNCAVSNLSGSEFNTSTCSAGDSNTSLTYTIANASASAKGGVRVSLPAVKLPATEETVTATVSGTAGVVGTLKIATTKKGSETAANSIVATTKGDVDKYTGYISITEGIVNGLSTSGYFKIIAPKGISFNKNYKYIASYPASSTATTLTTTTEQTTALAVVDANLTTTFNTNDTLTVLLPSELSTISTTLTDVVKMRFGINVAPTATDGVQEFQVSPLGTAATVAKTSGLKLTYVGTIPTLTAAADATVAAAGTTSVVPTNATGTVTYASADTTIATVDTAGTVTVDTNATPAATVVITATDSLTAQAASTTITVGTPAPIELSGDITLAAGWNFVSAPFDGSIDVATIAAAGCSQVHLADTTTGFWGAAVTTGSATPGQGVAAYCASAGTASYTGVTPAATAFDMATNITATGSTAVPSTHAAYAVGANFKVVGTPTATTFADVITAGATGVMYYNGTAFDLSSEYTSAGFTGVADNAAQTIPAGASFYIQTK